jgi:hypothetical protein
MVLFSLYTVSLCSSWGWDCREHEFLDIREYHVWSNYDVRCRRTHWFVQRCTVTRATPGTETYTTTPGNSQDRSWCISYSGRCLGPKCCFGAGKKNSRCENLHFVSHIFKSSLRALIRRDVVSDTYVTPDRMLVFAVIGCWFPPCFVSHVPRPDVLRGLWKCNLWLFSGRIFQCLDHVRADKCPTPWRQNFRSKNKVKPNLILEIAKVTWNISIKTNK